MYKINFNHLYYFLTIAREGSIVQASKVLNMTQPALSHQLRLLEEDLGHKLFDRVGRRLVLNGNGKRVFDHANKIFRQSEEMLASLDTEIVEAVKIVKIGVVPWISKDQIYEMIRPALFTPRFQVQVFQKDVDGLLLDVENEELDLALMDGPYSERSKSLQGHFVKKEPIVCVASSATPFKGRFPKSIADKKMINYPEACLLRDMVDKFIHDQEVEIHTSGAFTDIGLIRVAVEKGGVVGFLPKSVVKQGLKSKALKNLGTLKGYEFSLWAVTQKGLSEEGFVHTLLKKMR